MKFQLLLINAIDIEGFLYVNFIPVFLLFIITILFFYNYKTYINFVCECPKCSSVHDISRIKKNKIFKKIGVSDSYRKYSCRKCHNKFYVFTRNTENANKLDQSNKTRTT